MARRRMTTSKVSDKINANELAELFGLTTYDDLHEHNIDYIWEAGNYAYKEALDDDASEEEAEEARDKAEQEADRELFENWHSALMNAAEYLFQEHGLTLAPVRGGEDYPFEFRVAPETSWGDAARKIVETINGVGYFHFDSLRDFLDSGPYTPRTATLEHLHYINRYPEVYGSDSARSIFDRHFR
jgi:hypothetical protein